jgi:flavin-dependent dehydrogenase
MSVKKKVHIVGAGLSGMVAAINLARDGHEVVMLEAAKEIGGIHPHHPSNHGTPINTELIKSYVGIDITPVIRPCHHMNIVIKSHKFNVPIYPGYSLERGPRKTSIDTFLYEECKKLGVKFEFNQEIKDPFDLPDPTIIATGLFRYMYGALSRPTLRLPCFSARCVDSDKSRDGNLYSWFGSYSDTYGYASIANELGYYLLFSNSDLTLVDLKNFEEELEKSEGIKFDHWDYFEVFVPVSVPDAPKLYCGSKILAGTLSGMMEPTAYFGIHGALISGKIAALAVTDPETASRDFAHFNRNFNAALRAQRMMSSSKWQTYRLYAMRYPIIPKILAPLMSTPGAIPGIEGSAAGIPADYVGRL